jgi:isopenicillin N synthase-like dioxygenase
MYSANPQLNIPKFTPDYASVPKHDFINTFKDEIAPFQRQVWEKVIRKLLILFAIILELPENYFVDRHHYDAPSEDHIRYVGTFNTAIVHI